MEQIYQPRFFCSIFFDYKNVIKSCSVDLEYVGEAIYYDRNSMNFFHWGKLFRYPQRIEVLSCCHDGVWIETLGKKIFLKNGDRSLYLNTLKSM